MAWRVLSIFLLYLGFVLSWIGTFATTCTQNDTDSLLTGMILSAPFYLAGTLILLFQRLGKAEAWMAAPLLAVLLWQAVWGARLVWLVFVADLATCNLITGEYFGHVTSPVRERVYGAYYLAASLIPIAAIVTSHWRYRRSVTPVAV